MKKRVSLSLVLVTIFSFFAGFSLLSPGLPPTHDGEYHVVRFYQFYKTLEDGNFYPRWAPDLNNGYGIPLFNYVYPLPNYVASFLHFFGFSFIDSFKLNLFAATIVGGIFFYLWSRRYWGEVGGIISATFYSFSPYRFVDIYIRGSVGEVWALAFFPTFLWSTAMFFEKRKTIFIVLSGIFLACIIFSHNILALMFFPFALSYLGFLIFQTRTDSYLIRNALYIILLGLGLSAIFWIPAIFEREYVTGLQIYDVEKNFPELYQLLIPSWGSGFSQGSLEGQMSYQIGIANLVAVIVSFIATVVVLRRKGRKASLLLFFLFWFFLVFFLMLKISYPLWNLIPLMEYFQFPWRFLSLMIVVTSFLAGGISVFKRSLFVGVFLILLSIGLGIGYAKPAYYHYRDDAYYFSRANFIDGTNSPGNTFNTKWFNRSMKKEKEKLSINSGEAKPLFTKATYYRFSANVTKESNAVVNTAYFPGWIVRINGKEGGVAPNENGLIKFHIPSGNYTIDIQFTDTFVRRIATAISFFTFLFIVCYLSFYFRSIILLKSK